jgi:site-specific recombinase XerD
MNQLNQDDDNLRTTSTIWRRHSANCDQRAEGRYSMNCGCPLWGDGYVNFARVLRQSLNTRNIQIARKRIGGVLDDYIESIQKDSQIASVIQRNGASGAPLIAPAEEPRMPADVAEDTSGEDPGLIVNAVDAFLDTCETNGVKPPTIRKYRNSLNKLVQFAESDEKCRKRKVSRVSDLTATDLDRFRKSRNLAPITSLKELETLRQFGGWCVARDLCSKNIPALIKAPKIVDQNEVVPYTQDEMQAMIDACNTFGLHDYERKRARAIVLTLQHTALRVSDVALMRRDRVSRNGDRWRIFLRTTKNNAPVYLPVPDVMVEAINAVPLPRKAGKICPWVYWNGHSKPKSQISEVSETLAAVFRESGVADAEAHRFRHTLATELLGEGASFEEVADILGNSPEIVRKHYAKWSAKRQDRVDKLMKKVHNKSWKRNS